MTFHSEQDGEIGSYTQIIQEDVHWEHFQVSVVLGSHFGSLNDSLLFHALV